MAFMKQDQNAVLDANGAPVYGPNGPLLQPVGEAYECVWVQTRATGEVIAQSSKAALQLFAGNPEYRILSNDSGAAEYARQQGDRRSRARAGGRISDFEEELHDAEDIADEEQDDPAAPGPNVKRAPGLKAKQTTEGT